MEDEIKITGDLAAEEIIETSETPVLEADDKIAAILPEEPVVE